MAVVDDDAGVLESLQNLLESAGIAVRLFASAAEFLGHEGFGEIDCLISDIGMPAMDGFELQRRVRVARPELAVILITGRHDLTCDLGGGCPRERRFFHKPFNGQELLDAVTTALPILGQGR